MSFAHRRIHTVFLVVILASVSMAVHAGQTRITFDLAAQPLARALLSVGRQAGVDITFDPAVVRGHLAPALKGSYTVRQALGHLLEKSGLTVQTTPKGSFLIVRDSGAPASPSSTSFPSSTYTFHLPAQSLVATLRAIQKKTGREIELGPDARSLVGKNVAAVNGTLTPLQAVREALANTRLQVSISSKGTLTISNAALPGSGENVRTLPTVVSTATVSGLSATRTATPLREIPQSVSVIGQQRMRTQNLDDLDDVMNQATGITVVRNGMLNSEFYSRGFETIHYHVDGGAAITPAINNIISPDMSEYTRVEVLRGSDALFGGAGTPGATINLVRKKAQAVPALKFSQLAGSWRTFRTVLDATGPIGLNGKLDGRVVASYDSRHFYYHTARLRKRKLYATVAYHPGSSTTLTLGGSAEWRDDIPWTSGLPRYLDGGDIHLPRSTFLGTDWQRERARSVESFVELTHSFSKQWKLKFQMTRLQGYSNELSASLDGPVQRGTGYLLRLPSETRGRSTFTSLTGNFQLSGGFSIDGWAQKVLVGIDYEDSRNGDLIHNYAFTGGAPLSIFHLRPYSPSNILEFSEASPLRLKQYAAYTAFQLHALARGLTFSIGVRDSFYKRDATNTILAPDGSLIVTIPSRHPRVSSKPTPLLGVTYDFSKHYSIYASYANIYAPPAPNERQANGSPFESALNGVNLELGVKGAWYGGLLNGEVSVFKIKQSGVGLLADRNPAIPDCCFVSGTNRSKGFEFDLNGSVARGWQVGIGYTVDINHKASLPGVRGGTFQTQTPRNMLKLWTNYRLPGNWSRWSMGGDLHAQSRSYEDGLVCAVGVSPQGQCIGPMSDFHVAQGFYTVMGVYVGYRFSPSWQLSMNVNNVLDRVYYQTTGNPISGSWYGTPRNIMLTLRGTL